MNLLIQRFSALKNTIEQSVFECFGKQVSFQEAQSQIYSLFQNILDHQKKVIVVGNGGSAGIASHHTIDLLNVLKLPSITLTDSNLVTCMSNDYGYQSVFSRPISTLANSNDLLIAISSSGNSENILRACLSMKKKGGNVMTLSGFEKTNPLRNVGNINIWCPMSDYGLVESAHFFILHTLVDGWLQNKAHSSHEKENLSKA